MKRKAKVVVEVTFSDLRLMRESLLALRNMLIAEGRHTAPVDEMLERLFSMLAYSTIFSMIRGGVAGLRPRTSYVLQSAFKFILSTIISRSRTLSFAVITFSAKLSSIFSCTFRSHVP